MRTRCTSVCTGPGLETAQPESVVGYEMPRDQVGGSAGMGDGVVRTGTSGGRYTAGAQRHRWTLADVLATHPDNSILERLRLRDWPVQEAAAAAFRVATGTTREYGAMFCLAPWPRSVSRPGLPAASQIALRRIDRRLSSSVWLICPSGQDCPARGSRVSCAVAVLSCRTGLRRGRSRGARSHHLRARQLRLIAWIDGRWRCQVMGLVGVAALGQVARVVRVELCTTGGVHGVAAE